MRIDRALLLAIVGLLLVLSTLLVLPYVQFLLGAVVLAFVLRPLQDRLAPRIGETPAAATLVVGSVIAILFPFFFVAAFVAGDVARFVNELQEREFEVADAEETITEHTGREIDLESTIRSALENLEQGAFDSALFFVETLTHFLIGMGLLLFLLFFFVRDGDRFVNWARDVSPLPETVTNDLLDSTHDITRAVLAGHVLVAIVQGAVAGVGLVVTGIPNAVFWTFIMMILGLIPIIGTFVVWAPASGYLFVEGSTFAAVALFVYGSIVTGLFDEYLRPVFVDRYAEISPSVIIVGVIGGISVFGFMGLFVGPIVVGVLKETIEVYDAHYGREPRT